MSFEKEIREQIANGEKVGDRVTLSVLKYFWQLSPLSGGGSRVIPKFLRRQKILNSFSDNELRVLSKYLHYRNFSSNEAIFKQGDSGVGFYFVFSGQVDMYAKKLEDASDYVTSLEKGGIFGELAILQERTIRTATAVAKENCELLGFFKPDLEEMITLHPIVGAKLLHVISGVLATRFSAMASEMRVLKRKLLHLEGAEEESS